MNRTMKVEDTKVLEKTTIISNVTSFVAAIIAAAIVGFAFYFQTNFLLVKFPDTKKHNATNAEKFLADRGILVRGMKVYGLPNHLRISIGNEKENIVLIRELKSFLENSHEF